MKTSILPKSYWGPNICCPTVARAKNGQNSENFVNSEWHLSEGWNQKLTDAMGTGYWPKPNFHRNICCVKDVSYIFNIFVNNMHTICGNLTLKKEKQTNKEQKSTCQLKEKNLQGMYFSIQFPTFGIFLLCAK